MNVQHLKKLSVWAMILITIGAVDNLRNLPATALFGSKIIAFYALASMFFLIPSALVSAELSAKFPNDHGVYSWVKAAFGPRWGLIAVWMQWVENVPFFPAILSFVAATLAYLISPTLANNKYFLLAFVLVVFWVLTLVNLFGVRLSARFSSVCTAVGLVIPMVMLISIGIIWLWSGHPVAMHLSLHDMMPHWGHLSVWVTMQGVLLSLCGIELATVHAKDTINPTITFPVALLVSVTFIILTLVMGALSIAWLIPASKLSLVSGIMETFYHFLKAFHLSLLLPIFGLMIALGSLGGVNSWIIAPTRGLRVALCDSTFPSWLTQQNRHLAPTSLLILQAVLVSIIICAFFLIPSINGAYWLLSVLAAQIYMIMYLLMFAASFTLKVRHRHLKTQHYQIPGGLIGHLVAILGLIGAGFAFCICFIPPNNISIGQTSHYEWTLVCAVLLLCTLPFILYMACSIHRYFSKRAVNHRH